MAEQTFQSTAVDWSDIGDQLFTGFLRAINSSEAGKDVIAGALSLKGQTLGALYDLALKGALKLGQTLKDIEDPALPFIAALVAPSVAEIFGAEVKESDLLNRLKGSAGNAAAVAIVQGLIDAMEGTPGDTLEPGRANAARFAGAAVHTALEGTFNALAIEMLSHLIPELGPKFEDIVELPDNVIQVLGVSRLIRRALSPLVDATCATPMRWDVNKRYRPELLSTALAVRQFHRGKYTREELDEELARQGWSPKRIEALIYDASQHLSDAQIERLRAATALDDKDAKERLRRNGWSAEDAEFFVRTWKVDRVYAYADREFSALASAFINRELTQPEFSKAVGFLIPEESVAASAKSYAEHARAYNVKHMSHGEIKECVTRGILGRADYRRWLDREGYPEQEAIALEILLTTEMTDQRELEKKRAQAEAERVAAKQTAAAERAQRQAEIAERNARTFPSLGDIERAVVRGLLDVTAYAQRLEDLKYAEADRAFLVALLEQQREEYLEAQQRKHDAEAERPERAIGLADLERAVITGRASLDDYRRRLESDAYAPGDIALMVALLGDRIADARAAEAKRRAAEAALARKGLSLAQVEKTVRQGLTSIGQYRAFLDAQGFAAEDTALLAASLAQDIAEAEAAARTREAVNASARGRGVSLATLERSVKLGVRTRADYADQLVKLGVSIDDQVTLLGILDAELADLNAARATREQPAAPAAAPGLSRADMESAVRAGLASVDTYRAYLREAGYPAGDVETLANLLLLELQEAGRARARRDALDAENPARALARSDLERAVKAGIRTIAEYGAQLTIMGYDADDRALLVALLEHDLAAKHTAAQRRAALVETLAAADLDLEAMDAAVLSGDNTIDEYIAALVETGVKPVDVALLVQTLLEKRAGVTPPDTP